MRALKTSFLFLFLIAATAVSLRAEIDHFELTQFESPEHAVRITYPDGWFLTQGTGPLGYWVRISKDQPDPRARVSKPVVLELDKIYHASITLKLGQGEPQSRLDRYCERFLQQKSAKVVAQRNLNIQSAQARLLEVRVPDPVGAVHPMFFVAALRNDVLATLSCEAPADRFDSYRRLFETVASRLEPFSSDPTRPDL